MPSRETIQPASSRQTETFFRLFAATEGRVFAYVLALVHEWNDAEEIFQETCVALWESFAQFDRSGSVEDFFRWASRIALHRVLAYRKKRHRERTLFGDAFVEAVAAEFDSRNEEAAERLAALKGCVDKLNDKDRELLEERYGDGGAKNVQQLAAATGRPADTLYKGLRRIRRALLDCITRALRAGGAT